MPSSMLWLLLSLLCLALTPRLSGAQLEEEWCIADEQTPAEELKMALDWACEKGGADCSKIQENQACYLPNTLQHHASYAFNSYYQKFKQQGATCYFNALHLSLTLIQVITPASLSLTLDEIKVEAVKQIKDFRFIKA